MKRQIKWTMIPTLIAALNTALIAFGTYHLANEQLQAVNLVLSVAGTMFGIALNNHEEKPSN